MPYKRKITDHIFQSTGFLLLALLWVFIILTINKSGDKVPSHFKLDGTIDGYAGKWTLWIIPIAGTVMYFVMRVLIRILPRLLPYSMAFSQIKSEKRQLALSNILKVFQILFIGQFTCISLSSFLIATNRIQKIPAFIFPSFLIGILILIILLLIQYLRSDNVNTDKMGV